MARVKVKLDIQGIREVMKSSGTAAVLRQHAEATAAAARGTAPVAEIDGGQYRDSIRVESRVHRVVAVARVVADVPYAMAVEARTGNLARSLR